MTDPKWNKPKENHDYIGFDILKVHMPITNTPVAPFTNMD